MKYRPAGTILLACLSAFSAGIAKAGTQSVAFKGDTMGMSLADFEVRHNDVVDASKLPYFVPQTTELRNLNTIAVRTIFPFEETSYGRSETIAGVNARIVYYFQAETPADLAAIEKDPRGVESYRAYLIMIEATIDPSDYQSVLDAMTVKYGKPARLDKVDSDSTTAAHLGSRIARWSFPPCDITARESLDNSPDKAEVRFTMSEVPDGNADAAKRNSKDL